MNRYAVALLGGAISLCGCGDTRNDDTTDIKQEISTELFLKCDLDEKSTISDYAGARQREGSTRVYYKFDLSKNLAWVWNDRESIFVDYCEDQTECKVDVSQRYITFSRLREPREVTKGASDAHTESTKIDRNTGNIETSYTNLISFSQTGITTRVEKDSNGSCVIGRPQDESPKF